MTIHTPSHFGAATRPEELSAIRDPAVPAVIWRRNPPARLMSWLNRLPVDLLPRTRAILYREDVSEALIAICAASGTPPAPERDLLVEDVANLADTFAEIIRAPRLRLRLDVIEGDGCSKFHVDRVAARLLCTYRGTGTQLRHGGQIYSVLAGDVVVVRGTDWPGGVQGAEHRSPRKVPGAGARLLLVIDPVFDPEEEA